MAYKGITKLSYNISPSNATLANFEVVGLLEQTSEVLPLRSSNTILELVKEQDGKVKADLNNGILTVYAKVFADDYNLPQLEVSEVYSNNNEDIWKNVSVALQVKNKNLKVDDDAQYNDDEERLVVSSQYVNAVLAPLFGQVELTQGEDVRDGLPRILPEELPYEVEKGSYPADINLWNGYNADTKTYTPNDPRATIDLNEYVRAIAYYNQNVKRTLESIGYEGIEDKFVFTAIDLISEGVNHKDYVVLDNGKISVKPDGNSANQAAVGRTPVIKVEVKDGDRTYAVGYIKILITEDKDNRDITIDSFNLGSWALDCNAKYEFSDNVTDSDMDKIFNHPRVKLGKDDFFKQYTGIAITEILRNGGNKTDELKKHFEFIIRVKENTQSGEKYNYIEGNVDNKVPFGTYVIKTTITPKANVQRPKIVLTWTLEVKAPTGIQLTSEPAIMKDKTIEVNPSIYGQTGVKSSTVYESLLNNAFKHNNNNFDFGITQGNQQCDGFLTPEFVFTKVPGGFSISTDGLTVTKGGKIAAKIEVEGGKFNLRLNEQNSGDNTQVTNYKPYPAAIEFLKAATSTNVVIEPKAVINGQPLNKISLFEGGFKVKFIYQPLSAFNFDLAPTNGIIYDKGTDGKNKATITINGKGVVRDFNLGSNNLGTLIKFGSAADKDLIRHYGIELADEDYTNSGEFIPAIDFGALVDANRTKEIIVNGKAGGLAQGMSLKILSGESVSDNTSDYYKKLVIEWTNSNTGALQEDLVIEVPVSLGHKWGTLNGKFKITVKPGSGK